MMPLLAQNAGAEAQPQGGGAMGMIVFMVLILVIWWLLVLRPQSRNEKARKAKIEALQKGDRVRTRGGIEGTVVRVQDDRVVLKIDVEGKVHVPFAKPYIEDVLTSDVGDGEAKS